MYGACTLTRFAPGRARAEEWGKLQIISEQGHIIPKQKHNRKIHELRAHPTRHVPLNNLQGIPQATAHPWPARTIDKLPNSTIHKPPLIRQGTAYLTCPARSTTLSDIPPTIAGQNTQNNCTWFLDHKQTITEICLAEQIEVHNNKNTCFALHLRMDIYVS